MKTFGFMCRNPSAYPGKLQQFLKDHYHTPSDDLNLLVKRARALQDVLGTEDGENLLQGFRRANNILSQAEAKDGVEYSYGADAKFAETDSEKALFHALEAAAARIAPALGADGRQVFL